MNESDCQIRVATEYGTDLSSRQSAKLLRKRIVHAADSGCAPVVVNFENVRTVSTSFADEVFAVLVEERGEQWFAENLEILCLSENVAVSIAEAVANRCEPA